MHHEPTTHESASHNDGPALPTNLPPNLPTDRRALLAGIGGLAAGALLAGSRTAHAGPINPPAGPVASTGKTLSEVEPRIAINSTNTPGDADSIFKITQPGSYYLTQNVNGISGRIGIEIAASNVTVDLNGFALQGVTGSLRGIACTLSVSNVTVKNGSVSNWGSHGLDLALTSTFSGIAIERVHALGNGGDGIRSFGSTHVIQCSASSNTSRGFALSRASIVVGCQAVSNGAAGVSVGDGSVVVDCVSRQNVSQGFVLFGNSVTVSGCTAYSNQSTGFDGSTAGSGSTFTRCSATANGVDGFSLQADSIVETCTARSNSRYGISGGQHNLIKGCTATFNSQDGIFMSGNGTMVLENVCLNNGIGSSDGAGIHITSSGNRIEGNICGSNDRGIDVDAAGNIIIRNTCSGNTTNWDIAANNKCLVVNGINAAAILGNSGGTSPGSTNPNANYTF